MRSVAMWIAIALAVVGIFLPSVPDLLGPNRCAHLAFEQQIHSWPDTSAHDFERESIPSDPLLCVEAEDEPEPLSLLPATVASVQVAPFGGRESSYESGFIELSGIVLIELTRGPPFAA